MPLPIQEQVNLAIEILIVTSISSTALLFTIYCYFKFDNLRHCQFRLVFRILQCDLIYMVIMIMVSSGYLFLKETTEPLSITSPLLCQTQAFISNFAILSSCAWTSVICHKLYQQVISMNDKNYHNIYLVIANFFPALISIIPIPLGVYGKAEPMEQTNCFYSNTLTKEQFNLYITLFYYGPIWSAFLYNMIVIGIVVHRLRSITMQATTQFYALFAYPALLAICWIIPGIISQFTEGTIGWAYFTQLLWNSIGLLDALCYCFTEIFNKIEFVGCSLKLKEARDRTDTCDIAVTVETLASISNDSQQL